MIILYGFPLVGNEGLNVDKVFASWGAPRVTLNALNGASTPRT